MSLQGRFMTALKKMTGREIVPSFCSTMMDWSLNNLKTGGFAPRVALDLGAYQGEWTRLFTDIFPHASVLMVEPQEGQEELLHAVLRDRPLCQYRRALLGRTNGVHVLFDINNSASEIISSPEESRGQCIQMETKTLDSLVAGTPFEAPQIIKLDVQGCELEVLHGGSRALSSAEVVVMEASVIGLIPYAPSFYDVMAFMHEHGFRLYDICTFFRRPVDKALWQLDLIFVREASLLGAVSLGYEVHHNG